MIIKVFLLTFSILCLSTLMMMLGVLCKRKPISGSCGGLGNVGIDKVCKCDKPCDKKKKSIIAQKLEVVTISND